MVFNASLLLLGRSTDIHIRRRFVVRISLCSLYGCRQSLLHWNWAGVCSNRGFHIICSVFRFYLSCGIGFGRRSVLWRRSILCRSFLTATAELWRMAHCTRQISPRFGSTRQQPIYFISQCCPERQTIELFAHLLTVIHILAIFAGIWTDVALGNILVCKIWMLPWFQIWCTERPWRIHRERRTYFQTNH